MRTRYLPALALFVCVWLGSPAVALGDSPIGAWSWFGTNPSSISVSYNCTTTVPNPDGSPYKVTTSAWATIADSSGTVVASYTSPVVVGSGTIDFTLTYDIPKAEQVIYWPWDQPLPSAPPGVLTFVGTLHTLSLIHISEPTRLGMISYADPGRANAELGWKATRTIDDMCTDSWRWQSQNPNGYPDA